MSAEHPHLSGQQFPKRERLCSKKITGELFSKGSSLFLYPYRIVYLPAADANTPYPQVLFSVSKKKIKRAVDRNLIKRRMREAYRRNKTQLINSTPSGKLPAYIAWVYVANEKISFEILEKKLIFAWRRLVNT
jgi:ribonuclease P protein component